MSTTPLRIAVWAGTAGDDLAANAAMIAQALTQAATQDAAILVTPECVLTGYPGCARASCHDLSPQQIHAHEEQLHQLAQSQGISLLLGSIGGDAQAGWTNDVVLYGDHPEAGLRYRKRCLTPMDRQHFIAGTQPGVINCGGWRIGLSICFDVRFGDVWADCALADCDLAINIAHMAGSNNDHGAKPVVIPAFYSVRAAEWATPVVLCNTGASDRWLDSGWWDHRGLRQATQASEYACYTIPARASGEHWHQDLRQQQLQRWRQRLGSAEAGE